MHVRRTLALATLPLLLAGCGGGDPSDDPTPIMPDPTTSTATPTETPTVDPLAIPDAMRDKSLKGAEAAVRHYFDMYNHLIETGDAKPIKRLYGDYCITCSAYVSLIELSHKDGNTTEGHQELQKARAYSGAKGIASVVVEFSLTSINEVTPAGKSKLLIKGSSKEVRTFNLAFQRGIWEILRIELPR